MINNVFILYYSIWSRPPVLSLMAILQKTLLSDLCCCILLKSVLTYIFTPQSKLCQDIRTFRLLFQARSAVRIVLLSVNFLYSVKQISAFYLFFDLVNCPFNGEILFHISEHFLYERTRQVSQPIAES
jgi:hypothetical protein